ncbi:hypothetical protein [Microbacterium paraoxydans]|jgi:hypothetical protein|uniref:Uncharacterized protein n=2 Tax=Microbacterium paraoxydans TaxID=199592 RepID=A0A1H1U075_9MICO|nr:hypothetical protein [Microbacterium paraoxydans]SDS65764.1 hypothetical protein SAMN04489809_2355 [Microbacterium paraoxydans]
MFEHPYLTQQVTAFEQEQIERAVARRRMLIEHADQILPRPAGPLRRLLRRLGRGSGAAANRVPRAGACDPAVAR